MEKSFRCGAKRSTDISRQGQASRPHRNDRGDLQAPTFSTMSRLCPTFYCAAGDSRIGGYCHRSASAVLEGNILNPADVRSQEGRGKWGFHYKSGYLRQRRTSSYTRNFQSSPVAFTDEPNAIRAFVLAACYLSLKLKVPKAEFAWSLIVWRASISIWRLCAVRVARRNQLWKADVRVRHAFGRSRSLIRKLSGALPSLVG